MWRPWHLSDSAAVTLPFTLWSVVNCPDYGISPSWCSGRSVRTTRKWESCLCEKRQTYAAIPWAWEADRWDEDQLWQMDICWRAGSNEDAYHTDKGVNATLFLSKCVLYSFPSTFIPFSLCVYLSSLFLFSSHSCQFLQFATFAFKFLSFLS